MPDDYEIVPDDPSPGPPSAREMMAHPYEIVPDDSGSVMDPHTPKLSPALVPHLARILKQNAAGIALQTAGAKGGELGGAGLAALLAPDSAGLSLLLPLVGAVAGSGAGNVAASKLPPDWGGNPDQSAENAFAWGAGPAAAFGGTGALLEQRAERTGAQAVKDALEARTQQFAKAAPQAHAAIADMIKGAPTTPEELAQISGAFGKSGGAPMALTGDPLMERTARLHDAASEPVQRLGQKLGKPIGDAYTKLKGGQPIDATDLAQTAQDIRDNAVSPLSAKMNSYLNQMSSFSTGNPQQPGSIELPNGEVFVPGIGRAPSAAERVLGGVQGGGPTLDSVRNLRQQLEAHQRTAVGGDRWAAAQAKTALDKKLMPFLPPEMALMKQRYANYIRLFDPRETNSLNRAATPREVADWTFGGAPERTASILSEATPEEKDALKDGLYERAFAGVNPDLPASNQTAQVGKNLSAQLGQPIMVNGRQTTVARELLGPDAAKQIQKIAILPMHYAEFAKQFASPVAKARFIRDYTAAANDMSATDRTAAERAIGGFRQSLSPIQRAQFDQLIGAPKGLGGGAEPVLLPPGSEIGAAPGEQATRRAGIKQALLPGKDSMAGWGRRRIMYSLGYGGAGGLLAGGAASGSHYMLLSGAGIAAVLGTQGFYHWLLRNGGAEMASRIYSTPAGANAARATLDALAAIGTRIGQPNSDKDNDDAGPPE